jgi:hypothetical protein
MAGSQNATPYYYSTQHLVRDFVGSVAPFTLFLIAACLTLSDLRDYVESVAARIPHDPQWLIVTAAIGIYVLVGYIVGALMNRLVLLYKLFSAVRRRGLDQIYSANQEAIALWYQAFMPDHGKLVGPATPEPVQQIERLIGYLRIYNPDGYLHVYREYTFLFVYRQCVGYSVLLAIAAARHGLLAVALCSLAAAALFCVIGISGLKQTVEAELNFIVSTVAWLEDPHRRTTATA